MEACGRGPSGYYQFSYVPNAQHRTEGNSWLFLEWALTQRLEVKKES